MTTTPTPHFSGLYGIPEAARYLAITPPAANGHHVASAKLRYWIRTALSTSAIMPLIPTRQRFITFRELISMRLIALLRSHEVSLQRIRDAERWLREELNVDWPFVRRPLWTYQSDIYVNFEQRIVAASRNGQLAMDVFGEWLRKVEMDMTFDKEDIAVTWSPFEQVRIDPTIQLGKPCIDGSRIPTGAIWSKIRAGDTVQTITRLYDLTETKIKHAVEWEERLVAT